MPGAGGAGGPNMTSLMELPGVQASMQAMMRDPAIFSMISQRMRAMLAEDPNLAAVAAAHPGLRATLESPEGLESMLAAMASPEMMRAMVQMNQATTQLRGGGLLPPAAPGAPGLPPGMDLSALLAGMGGGMGAVVPPADPETAYASQLQQLQDMGFFDRDSNVRALVATGGNVHAAVDRLLASL
jgi:ubiquilin